MEGGQGKKRVSFLDFFFFFFFFSLRRGGLEGSTFQLIS